MVEESVVGLDIHDTFKFIFASVLITQLHVTSISSFQLHPRPTQCKYSWLYIDASGSYNDTSETANRNNGRVSPQAARYHDLNPIPGPY